MNGRTWDDYSLGRGTTNEHLGALDEVYQGLIADHRKAQEAVSEIDPMTEDLVIAQAASSSCSTGSSARTWRTPAVSSRPLPPRARPRPPWRPARPPTDGSPARTTTAAAPLVGAAAVACAGRGSGTG